MNHFISGILKIILIEGSIALLLIDVVARHRYERARARAHGVLAGLMVFAWSNYGSPRGGMDVPLVFTSIPVIVLCGVAIGFAFDPDRAARVARLVERAKAAPRSFGRKVTFLVLAGALTLAAALGWFSHGGLALLDVGGAVAAVVLAGLAGRYAQRLASGARAVPALFPALIPRSKPLAVALVVLLSGAWVGGGVAAGKLPITHSWEQFHFYLGAKYQREVGWLNLYKAVILADRESVNALANMPTTRDLTNFEQVPVETALKDAAEVKARFSPAQWEAFKADWAAMTRIWPINWTAILNDHGNSNSPTWSIVATPIARLVPLSSRGQALLGWLDLLLMLGMWLAVWQTFGHRAASVGLFIWAVPPIVFEYSVGSFLRWDWLFALGLAACFLKQKRSGWAGGFFGYAVATKLFPLFFGVALGLRALMDWREKRTFAKEHLRFAVGAIAAGAVAVSVSAVMFGPEAWKEYAQRIAVAQVEKFYPIQYSFKAVYLQHAAEPMARWGQTIFPGDLAVRRADVDLCKSSEELSTATTCERSLLGCGDGHRYTLSCATTGACTCSKNGVAGRTFTRELPCAQSDAERGRLFEQECGYPKDYSFGFLVARVLFSLLIVVLIRRATDVEAFLLGPLLVFTWLTVNMYYWNMLGLLALGLATRWGRGRQPASFAMLLGLHATFIIYYLYQHLNRSLTEGYAVAWLLTVVTVLGAAWEARTISTASREAPSPPDDAATTVSAS